MTSIDFFIATFSLFFAQIPTVYTAFSIQKVTEFNSREALGNWQYVLILISLVIIVFVFKKVIKYSSIELKRALDE